MYHQRGIPVYIQQTKALAKAPLDDTAVSTRAVYQPRELYISSNEKKKRTHFWSTGSARHGRVDLGGVSTSIYKKRFYGAAVYHQRGTAGYLQQSKTKKKKRLWTTQTCHQTGVSIAISRANISGAAVYHQRGVAISTASKSNTKAYLDDTAVSTGAVY